MRRVNDIERFFRMMDDIFNNDFTGGIYDKYEDTDDSLPIYEDDKFIYITLELRGVRDEDYTVKVYEDKLFISVVIDGQYIERSYPLPIKVNAKTAKIKFNNFILDIVLEKEKKK